MLKDIRKNPLMLTDVYNLSHQRLKINTDWETSHIYNRAKPMILYGLSEIINTILTIQITEEMIDEADTYATQMGVKFPKELFQRVVWECNGYFPIWIQALPEGTYCPTGTPFAQIRNTVEGFGELVTWLEGILLHVHFPSTTATQAFRMRKYLEMKQRQYGYDDSFLVRFHSFGFRGHRSLEDAYWASTSWNMFLFGTDDFHSIQHTPNATVGSISALAHKVTQQFDDEIYGYQHAIDATAKAGEKIIALVIDTYDAERFINVYLLPLANYAFDKGVHIVVRPDSGDTWKQVADAYKIVKQHRLGNVTAIIGENMDFENAKKADSYFEMHNVPLNFVSYGIGGGFYNYINRDTLGFAMKTAFSNGKPRMKFGMSPIKRSIPNIVQITKDPIGNLVVSFETEFVNHNNLYQTVYFHNDLRNDPSYIIADWEQTRTTALAQETDQHYILLASEVHELIAEFEQQYK